MQEPISIANNESWPTVTEVGIAAVHSIAALPVVTNGGGPWYDHDAKKRREAHLLTAWRVVEGNYGPAHTEFLRENTSRALSMAYHCVARGGGRVAIVQERSNIEDGATRTFVVYAASVDLEAALDLVLSHVSGHQT